MCVRQEEEAADGRVRVLVHRRPDAVEDVEREFRAPTIEAWKDEPDTAWKLFNAATQVAKGWSEQQQIVRTQKLSAVFKKTFSPALVPAMDLSL
jgi:hypothetical protein